VITKLRLIADREQATVSHKSDSHLLHFSDWIAFLGTGKPNATVKVENSMCLEHNYYCPVIVGKWSESGVQLCCSWRCHSNNIRVPLMKLKLKIATATVRRNSPLHRSFNFEYPTCPVSKLDTQPVWLPRTPNTW